MHGDRLSTRKTVRTLPVSVRFHLCQQVEGAGEPATEELGQYQARTDHAAQDFLEGRCTQRLPQGVLEVCAGASAAWRSGRPDRPGPDRPSPDLVLARSFWRAVPAVLVSLRSSSAMACRRRQSMLTRSTFSEASLGGWLPTESRSVMSWWHRVHGSLWAMRSARYLEPA